MRQAICIILTLATLTAHADEGIPQHIDRMIDWQCMTDCQNRGYIYQYCQKVCSY